MGRHQAMAKGPYADMNYVFDFKERVGRGTHHHYPLQYKHDKQQ